MTDKDLRRDVLDELDFDPSLDSGDIGVAVSEGVAAEVLVGHRVLPHGVSPIRAGVSAG